MNNEEFPILSAEEAVAAQPWQLPSLDLDAPPAISGGPVKFPTVEEMESHERDVYEQARQEGIARGLAEGRAQGQAEVQARLRQLEQEAQGVQAVLGALAQPLRLMDEQVVAQLTELSMLIARQLLRHELRADPGQVIGIVRETVALLPIGTREILVQLHPEDARLLRERLAAPQDGPVWQISEDPVMSRGGCRVVAGAAQIDARIETRIRNALAALLGEERGATRSGEAP
jgi:flagellar assembly protein FliH